MGICSRGNHRNDDITIVSMTYIMSSMNIYYRQTCNDWQLYELFVKLTCMVILELSLITVPMRTHMNISLAHVLVDDYISQVIDIKMSN